MPAPGNTHIFRRIWPLLDPDSCLSGYPAKSGDALGANQQTQGRGAGPPSTGAGPVQRTLAESDTQARESPKCLRPGLARLQAARSWLAFLPPPRPARTNGRYLATPTGHRDRDRCHGNQPYRQRPCQEPARRSGELPIIS